MPEPVEELCKDLLQPIKDLEKSFSVNISELLQKYLSNLQHGAIAPNFNSAALVLQGSSSIYGKKVDHLHNLALQLNANLKPDRFDEPNKKETKEKEKVVKDKESRLNDPFFSTDIKPGKNLSCLRKKKTQQQATKKKSKKSDKKFAFVPVDLLPLEGEAKGDVFHDTRGDPIGNKNDYTLNKCRITTSGWLLLPTVSPNMVPTEFSSPDYTLEPEPMMDESCFSGGGDVGDSSPPDEGYPASEGCNSLPSSQATSSQPANSQTSDEGFGGSVPSSPSEPLNTAGQPCEPQAMDGVVEGATTAPTAEDGVNAPAEGDDMANRRQSLRQALKLCQLEQEAAQNTPPENPVEVQNEEEVEPDVPAVRKVIQKKAVSSLPARLRIPGDELYIQTASEFCARTFFSMDNKVLKNAINKFGVTAFGVNTKLIKMLSSHYEFMRSYSRNNKKSDVAPDLSDDEDSLDMLDPSTEVMKADDSYGSLLGPPLLDDADIVIENDPVRAEDMESQNALEGIAPVPSTSVEEPPLDDDILYQPFEPHAHKVIKAALEGAGVDKNAEISRKVYQWEQKIKPFLAELDKREKFDINVYGSRILDTFEDNNRKQTICFREFCKGKESWEIHRYFMALLPLVNIGNVSIETEPNNEFDEDILVTLLSRKMHHKELEAFGHGEDGGGHY